MASIDIERYLALATDAVALLEEALAITHGDPGPLEEDASLHSLFYAADALSFALARYRADRHQPLHPPDSLPF